MRSLQIVEFASPLRWAEADTPEPTGRQVLLETVACGVCHSDLHLWEGYYDLGGGKRSYVKDRGVALPLTLGHEVVGRVVATGPEADVRPGDLRLVYPWLGCGECVQCTRDRHNLCSTPRSIGVYASGGYSDRVLVPDSRFLVDIGELPPEVACSYACAGLTAYSALKKLPPLGPDDHLLLIGAGGLGLMALQLARYLTPARLVVVDVNPAKLSAAREVAECVTIDASGDAAFRGVRDVAGRAGVPAAIDFVGSTDTATLGFSLLAKDATLIAVGLFGGELVIPTPALPLKSLTVRGSYTGTFEELRELVSLARSERLSPLPVSCHPLQEAQHVLERLRDGSIIGRAVLRADTSATFSAPT